MEELRGPGKYVVCIHTTVDLSSLVETLKAHPASFCIRTSGSFWLTWYTKTSEPTVIDAFLNEQKELGNIDYWCPDMKPFAKLTTNARGSEPMGH